MNKEVFIVMSASAYYTGAYLGPFLRPVTDLLETLAREIGEGDAPPSACIRGQYHNANELLWQQTCDLLLHPANTHFFGSGARAFFAAVQRHLLDTNGFMDTLNQVETTLSTYTNSVVSESNGEDEKLTALTYQLAEYCNGREDVEAIFRSLLPQQSIAGMIEKAIAGATIHSVLQDGASSDLLSSLETVYQQILERGDQHFHALTQLALETDASPASSSSADLQKYVTIAADLLYRDVNIIFRRWSDMLQQCTMTLLQAIKNQQIVKPALSQNGITAGSASGSGGITLLFRQPQSANGGSIQYSASNAIALMSDGSLALGSIENGNAANTDTAFAFSPLSTFSQDVPFLLNTQQSSGTQPPRRGRAAMMSITRTALDQPVDNPATFTVFGGDSGDSWPPEGEDPVSIGLPILLPFRVRSGIQYTIDVPTNQPVQPPVPYAPIPPGTLPAIYPPPIIYNIVHWVDILDGRANGQPFSFNIGSSVDVYSGDGTYLRTAVGWPAAGYTTGSPTDWQITLMDPAIAVTRVPFPPAPGAPDPVVLFILKHNVYITASGITNGLTPPPPYTHMVSAYSPNDAGPGLNG